MMKKFIVKPDKKAGMMVNSTKDDINLDLQTMLGIKKETTV
jgi:hypothetical protein